MVESVAQIPCNDESFGVMLLLAELYCELQYCTMFDCINLTHVDTIKGGGMVKAPLMLAMGVLPSVSSATVACMILYTSFTATTSYIVFGRLIYDYAIACFLLGFVSTYIGQYCLTYMFKSSRNSYIAFSIGIVIVVSVLLMTIQSVMSIMHGGSGGAGEESGDICSSGAH
jgi:hypothetical protein